MFKRQIEQANDLIERTRMTSEVGIENLPKSKWIHINEPQAWWSASRELVRSEFGASSDEMRRFDAAAAKRSRKVDRILERDFDDSVENKRILETDIAHYHEVTGLLEEFEAKHSAKLSKQPRHTTNINNYGQANVIGDNARADRNTYTQKPKKGWLW